jgi:hypothetical protein
MGLKPPEIPPAPAAIELHIEELVLHGFRSSDRFCIGDAVEKELQRLLGKQGLSTFLAKRVFPERLDAGTFKVAPGAQPQDVGTQLAQRLQQRLSSAERTRTATSPAKEGQKTR